MDVRHSIRPVVFILSFLLLASSVEAGKLSKLRNATQGKSPSATKPTPRSTPKPTSSGDEKQEQQTASRPQRSAPAIEVPRQENRRRDETSTASASKLGRIRQSTRSRNASVVEQRHHHRQSSRYTRPQRSHRARRHRDPSFGIGFYSHYSSPACLPTVVEEHHYYAPPPAPVVLEPVVPEFAPAPIPVSPPPVVLAESPIIVSESCQETAILEEPFEIWSPFQLRFEIDYAGDEADVDRTGFGLLLNATGGLGIDTGVRIFREPGDDFRDHLWLGDFNVTYELFPTEFIRTRAGVGFNWLADRYGAEAGLNLTLGSELFAGPVVFSGEVDMGTLGDADLLHGRLTASWRQGDHLEWFAGYDYLDVGGTEISGVVGGLRFRF